MKKILFLNLIFLFFLITCTPPVVSIKSTEKQIAEYVEPPEVINYRTFGIIDWETNHKPSETAAKISAPANYEPPEIFGGEEKKIEKLYFEDQLKSHAEFNPVELQSYLLQGITSANVSNSSEIREKIIADCNNYYYSGLNINIANDDLKYEVLLKHVYRRSEITENIKEYQITRYNSSWTPPFSLHSCRDHPLLPNDSTHETYLRKHYVSDVFYYVPPCIRTDPADFEHDMGYIYPVIHKISENTYALWYTEVKKMYDSNDRDGFYRKYHYQYTPCAKKLTYDQGEGRWVIIESDDFLSGLSFNENENTIIVDMKQGTGYYVLYYLSKETPDTDDDSGDWNLYSAFTSDVMPVDWSSLLDNNKITAMEKGSSGFDTKSLGRVSVLVDSGTNKFQMWYAGEDYYTTGIGTAFSKNGIVEWKKDSRDAAYKPENFSFDFAEVADPSVLRFKNSENETLFRMWYSGLNTSGQWRIGLVYTKNGRDFSSYDEGRHLPLSIGGGADVRYPYVIKDGMDADGNDTFIMVYSKLIDRNNVPADSLLTDRDKKIWTIELVSGTLTDEE